jgi:hypothetical protein
MCRPTFDLFISMAVKQQPEQAIEAPTAMLSGA